LQSGTCAEIREVDCNNAVATFTAGTSGGDPGIAPNAANVIRAAEVARKLKCRTIALTGGIGEPLASLCDVVVSVPSQRTSRIQEVHITIGHLWCEMVDAELG
jgi:fructoselysine-6-P-deglycase FrlB-like protein